MFDVCTTGDTAHYSNCCQTHASTCWRVCGNNLNIVSMCAVSPVVHKSNSSSCKKKTPFPCGCEQFLYVRSFGFLFVNVCNHGEHNETPCIWLLGWDLNSGAPGIKVRTLNTMWCWCQIQWIQAKQECKSRECYTRGVILRTQRKGDTGQNK